MNKIIKLGCVMLSAACVGLTAGCTPKTPETPLDANHGIADQSKLYGMCYLLEERSTDTRDIKKEVELMKNMGVKTVRQWMHFSHFLKSPTELKPDHSEADAMHELLAECEKQGMVNIGMNHHNFSLKGSSYIKNSSAKPFSRNVGENSDYVNWLNDYYDSWVTLVTEFPEVKYWEIDNELNNSDFMWDGVTKNSYSVRQMAAIATDMFYYASRAIHDANPSAQTVMGGLTEPNGLGQGNTATFLQYIYDNIASGEYGYFYGEEDKSLASKNADDYFQIACWHPYMSNFYKERFIEINNEYYQIILKNEGKHKKVFFTEIGWNDATIGGEQVAIDYMTQMFSAIESMPYVETVNIFKLYDVGKKDNWDSYDEVRFGLIHDPNYTRTYYKLPSETQSINIAEDGRCIPGAPKNKAYAYQRLAGGSGDLNLLVGLQEKQQ